MRRSAVPAPWRRALVSPSWMVRSTASRWSRDHEALALVSSAGSGMSVSRFSPAAVTVARVRSRASRSAGGAASPVLPRSARTRSRTSSRLAAAVCSIVVSVVRRVSACPTARAVAACTLIAVRLWPRRSWSSRASSSRSDAAAAARSRASCRRRPSARRRRRHASLATSSAVRAMRAVYATHMASSPTGSRGWTTASHTERLYPVTAMVMGLTRAPTRAAPRAVRPHRRSGHQRATACRLVRAVSVSGESPSGTGEK